MTGVRILLNRQAGESMYNGVSRHTVMLSPLREALKLEALLGLSHACQRLETGGGLRYCGFSPGVNLTRPTPRPRSTTDAEDGS